MTIKYNPANALVQTVIELIRNVKAIKIVKETENEYVPNAETIKAFKDIENGRNLHSYDSVENLMTSILGENYMQNSNN